MKEKILFVVSSAKQIGPKKRPTGNFLTETAHPYVTSIAWLDRVRYLFWLMAF
jgi:hypothetical protein